MSILKSMATVSGFTLLSRVLGLVREAVIANYLGTGMAADAFFSAFRFPNMFRRVFGEGAFNSAFVPLFARENEEQGKEEALAFASRTFSMLALVLLFGTIVALPLMSPIMSAVVPGFKAASHSPAFAKGEFKIEFPFSIKIDGRKDIYFTQEGKGSFTIREAKVSTPVESGPFASLMRVLGAEKPEKATTDLSSIATENTTVAVDGRRHFPLPPKHGYTRLEGIAEVEGPGRLQVFRNNPETFKLTVRYSQITFAYLLCMALAAHLSGVLNTMRIFGMPAAAPVLLNAIFLLGLLVAIPILGWSEDPMRCGYIASLCVLVAGFVQLGALWWTCYRKGLPVCLRLPKIDTKMKRLFALMGPGIIAAGIQQINLLVGGIIASYQEGAVSYIYYADRLNQLPLGIIGIALGVVLLPEVTRRFRSNDLDGARQTISQGILLALLITLPAMVAMIVIPAPIISVIFERGDFGPESTVQTAKALAAFAIGLPGYVLVKVLQPGYFAREDTRTPMMIAGVTVLVNIVVALLLFPAMRHVGLALATSVAAWVNVTLLAVGLRRHDFLRPDAVLVSKLVRTLGASLLMGVVVWFLYRLLGDWFEGGFLQKASGLAILVALGMACYGAAAVLLRATSVRELKDGFKKG